MTISNPDYFQAIKQGLILEVFNSGGVNSGSFIAGKALVSWSLMSESHWWHLFHKEGMTYDSTWLRL
jgi:hypothetical protein